MKSNELKILRRARRKRVIRKRVNGTAQRPRLTVFRSLKNIYAQLIDDDAGVTICQASTRDRDLREQTKDGGNVAAAKVVGTILGERARAQKVDSACFDRNGFRYHGRLKALAEAAREAGLKL